MDSPLYRDIRVVVVNENWLGATGLAALAACVRLGARASSMSEGEYVPIRWQSFGMRVIGKIFRSFAVREFNRALLGECDRRKADLLLVFKGPFVTADTLKEIRNNGTRSYCFYPDVAFDVHGPYLPAALRQYDWIFTSKTFGLRDLREQLGITAASYLPHAFDPIVHRPCKPTSQDLAMYACDVSFIGTWSPKKESVLAYLIQKRPQIKVKIWGNQWEKITHASLKQAVQFKSIEGLDYAAAIGCSKINLAILSERRGNASSGDLITSRTFEIPASGGLMLHERTPDLAHYFVEGKDCACFEGHDELVECVDQLLSDDALRRRISEQGRRTVDRYHSWDHRVRVILDHFLNRPKERGHIEAEAALELPAKVGVA